MKTIVRVFTLFLVTFFVFGSLYGQKYEANWQSLKQVSTPQWLQEGKFGIYTHWGPYAVHAYGSNTTWYSFSLYLDAEGEAREHFEKTFGKLSNLVFSSNLPHIFFKSLSKKTT